MTSQDSRAALAERYGAPPPWRRRATLIGSVVLGVVALGWLAWTIAGQTSKPVDSDLVSFDLVNQHTATALVNVRVRDDATGVECLLRAFAADHNVVGELSFSPAADEPDETEQTIRTDRQATSVELIGCTADGQARPS